MGNFSREMENSDTKHSEIEFLSGREDKKRKMEGLNSTMIYCKNICKCHNVPPIQKYNF
jgi:hypothetical protein